MTEETAETAASVPVANRRVTELGLPCSAPFGDSGDVQCSLAIGHPGRHTGVDSCQHPYWWGQPDEDGESKPPRLADYR